MRQQSSLTLLFYLIYSYGALVKGWEVTENRHFDPEKDNWIVANCSIPPFQDVNNYPKPGNSPCAKKSIPLSSLSAEEMHVLAEAYAPVLLFHPLEETSLQSPGAIFDNPSNGRIYRKPQGREDEPTLIDDNLNLETLLSLSKPSIANGKDYFFQHVVPDEYKVGAGYDYEGKVGLSKASIYYNALETSDGTWVFTYYFYYPGQMGQTVGFGLGLNQHAVLELPFGAHEGDWESMSVLACQSISPVRPAAITYQQHGFSQITDCAKGECILWKESNHPVGFVSLSTHATYPVASRKHVYLALTFNLPFLLPGLVFLADQTVYRDDETGAYRMFFPNSTNIVRHKKPQEIIRGVTPVSEYWQGYGGRWGLSYADERQEPEDTSRCLNTAQNQWQECPSVPLLDAILDIVSSYCIRAIGCLCPDLGDLLRVADAPFGPPLKGYFAQWEAPKLALLWTTSFPSANEETLCSSLGIPITIENEDSYQEGTTAAAFRLAMSAVAGASNAVGLFLSPLFG